MRTILLIHGPNLNLLGEREPDIYGRTTLNDINDMVETAATRLGYEIDAFQSNHEGAIIDFIHTHRKQAAGIIINPGAYTHYSYAIRDAIAGVRIPTVEVHLSDIHKRELFRQISVIEPVCIAQISGLGAHSYTHGLETLVEYLKNRQNGS